MTRVAEVRATLASVAEGTRVESRAGYISDETAGSMLSRLRDLPDDDQLIPIGEEDVAPAFDEDRGVILW